MGESASFDVKLLWIFLIVPEHHWHSILHLQCQLTFNILQLTRAVCVSLCFLSPTNMPGIHTNPSDVIDNSALATAWHVAGLPRVARECVPMATRLTTLFATLKCSEGFAKRQKGITAEICPGRKCVERWYDFWELYLILYLFLKFLRSCAASAKCRIFFFVVFVRLSRFN